MHEIGPEQVTRQELVRWAVSAAVIVLLHGLLAAAVLARPNDEDLESGSPVVMVDLAPIAEAPPAPVSDAPPGPQQQPDSQAQAEQKEKPKTEEVEKERPPDEAPQPDAIPMPQPDPQPTPDKPEQRAQDASVAAALPNAPVPADIAAAPTPGEIERPDAAVIASWQRSLVAQLKRFQRYPAAALGAGGVVRMAFQIDRRGHVLHSSVLKSSGSAALDAAALAVMKSADPLPPPPDGTADDQLTFTIPMRYDPAN
jgi:periplasmic protein TonB